jgi:RNA polymerase sigma factor (sigma-70 family)
MEVSALKHSGAAGIKPPLLRLTSDERLITLIRRGHHGAFEALVKRYQARLQAFCRHMLGSKEDAEDVLQEVFAAAFNAILADERDINVRPWLYRIARNRSLNHLRRVQAIGVDSMDIHLAEGGMSTADKVHKREEFRQLVSDVQDLPETQRTALLLREIDALSYDQIAEAMETTVPSVKSLLVRARVSLAEAAEARLLSCEQVRLELGEVAEGLTRMSSPVRRHVKMCDKCAGFRKQLKETNKALAAVYPIAPLLLFKKFVLAHLGTTTAAGGGAATAGTTAASVGGGSLVSAGASTVASKAVAVGAAAAIVTAGAVEVRHAAVAPPVPRQAAISAPPFSPRTVAQAPVLPAAKVATPAKEDPATKPADEPKPADKPPTDETAGQPGDVAQVPPPPAAEPTTTPPGEQPAAPEPEPKPQTDEGTVVLPGDGAAPPTSTDDGENSAPPPIAPPAGEGSPGPVTDQPAQSSPPPSQSSPPPSQSAPPPSSPAPVVDPGAVPVP